jgi:hypothetical protein
MTFAHILVIGWMFTAGFVPFDQNGFTKTINTATGDYDLQYYSIFDNTTHVGMSVNALVIDHINVRGSIESWQYPRQIDNWMPYRVKFSIGADVSLFNFYNNDFNAILSVDRYCAHPVNVCGDTEGKTNNAYLEIKLTIKGTKDIF